MFTLASGGRSSIRQPADGDVYEGVAVYLLTCAAHKPGLRSAVTHVARAVVLGLAARFYRPRRLDGRTWRDDYSEMSAAEWALLH